MKKMKILWPTDFSKKAEKALPYVNSLSMKSGAEVQVLCVIQDTAHHDSWYGEYNKEHIKSLTDRFEKTATKRLDQICKRYMDGCQFYIKHIKIGDPAHEILKLIDNENVDMVVMPRQDAAEKNKLTSITETVMSNSPIPVTEIPI